MNDVFVMYPRRNEYQYEQGQKIYLISVFFKIFLLLTKQKYTHTDKLYDSWRRSQVPAVVNHLCGAFAE